MLGWLHANIKNGKEYITRGERLGNSAPVLPHTDYLIDISTNNTPSHYILTILSELGMTRSTGMGLIGIDYQEIKAYLEATGQILDKWEIVLIHSLSKTYTRWVQTDKEDRSPLEAQEAKGMSRERYEEIMRNK